MYISVLCYLYSATWILLFLLKFISQITIENIVISIFSILQVLQSIMVMKKFNTDSVPMSNWISWIQLIPCVPKASVIIYHCPSSLFAVINHLEKALCSKRFPASHSRWKSVFAHGSQQNSFSAKTIKRGWKCQSCLINLAVNQSRGPLAPFLKNLMALVVWQHWLKKPRLSWA